MEINEAEGERHLDEEVVRVRGQKLCHEARSACPTTSQREIKLRHAVSIHWSSGFSQTFQQYKIHYHLISLSFILFYIIKKINLNFV